ncbi:helix-turn-helix transcriptional regulator [Actinophytocola sp.]|uniref:helix-turn-helix domain-containing protein n=1 Tax=Actinophytocola sp. TaxID=1872138 RepID=UPI002D7E8AEC|nr:helix-turn-helix transcriptional regulator [Actinophytocola sp.]HET9138319.1 helix-turn-helix transcriptional regulator [Actinophytocola sp.]
MAGRQPLAYGSAVSTATRPVGALLRTWRERRRLSQLELAIRAEISTRHLSFVETGRSRPTSDMIMRLSEQLDVPLRERNSLLLAGGYAPAYSDSGLDTPELGSIRDTLREVLTAHEPNPAVVVDRHWNLVDANESVALFLDGAAPELLAPPVNVLRLSLHPDGMAARIVNLGQWRAHLLARLRRQAADTGDPVLTALHHELSGYPGAPDEPEGDPADLAVPIRYRHNGTEHSFISLTAVFGTPRNVTLAELAIELFYRQTP